MRHIFSAFLLWLSCAAHAAGRPNFLLIFTDDHGYGDVSAYQPSDVRTPNIDRIGAEGMLFTGMRANCTVCSPSRAVLLTGRCADRVGMPGVLRTQPENSWGYFKPGVPTVADELKKAGYHTGTFVELAGGQPAPDPDAVSLVPILRGGTVSQPRDLYFVRREGGPPYGGKSYEAIIRGDWKLMQNDPFSPLELYNLKDDPQEKINLAATNKKLVNELGPALRQYIQHGGATPWQAPSSN